MCNNEPFREGNESAFAVCVTVHPLFPEEKGGGSNHLTYWDMTFSLFILTKKG